MTFDAIVVGSGLSGGWAAKELTERGLKTLVIERGPHVASGADWTTRNALRWERQRPGFLPKRDISKHYPVQSRCYAFTDAGRRWWVKDSEHPYSTSDDQPFHWIRGYQLGGRSLTWAGQCYRLSDVDFEANLKDGHGSDWPIRYADLAPWYDLVERFIGISGMAEHLPHLPDGPYLPPMEFTPPELDFKSKLETAFPGRRMIIGRCPADQSRFSSLNTTLAAAGQTGNLTILSDSIVHSLSYDLASGKVAGVRVVDTKTGEGKSYEARVIFLCASAIPTAQILLNSASEAFPDGLANRSGAVGRYLIDHVSGVGVSAPYPGFSHVDQTKRRPNGFYIPRYRNLEQSQEPFLRSFAYQGAVVQSAPQPHPVIPFRRVRQSWQIALNGYGEMLPNPDNQMSLSKTEVDRWGMPIPHIDCKLGQNEHRIIEAMAADAMQMLEVAGCTDITVQPHYGGTGLAVHEMGTAHMGNDPAKSVLNRYCQSHDVPNLFIADGSAMASSGTQNPSLTYMALAARSAHFAVNFLRDGLI